MEVKVAGFISCVCTAFTEHDLQNIADFSQIFSQIIDNFEIIVCIPTGMLSTDRIQDLCKRSQNLAIYEIASSSIDGLITCGLELALGDWILELTNTNTLILDASVLFENLYEDTSVETQGYQLVPKKTKITDRILSKLATLAIEVPIHTFAYMPRLTKRGALQTWNTRKLRSKVLRVAPQLNGALIKKCTPSSDYVPNYSRNIRVGLRTIAHSSSKPLRWVSFASLIGAVFSLLISATVVMVGISKNVVQGWTTTNLQISVLSFLILSVLGILTEYIYQIVSASIDQPPFLLVRESLSPRYSFKSNPNIIQSFENLE